MIRLIAPIMWSLAPLMTFAQFSAPRFICGKTMDDPTEVHAADFDGDGQTDLLCLAPNDIFDYDHELSWFRNEGNGEFEYLRPITDPQARPQAADVGDIDGDGDIDIMVGHDFSNTFGWFANDGAGNFGAFQLLYTGSDYPTRVHLVDLDGNGTLDLLASLRFAGNDDVFWLPNDGAGNFGPVSSLWSSFLGSLNVEHADLNGDGDQDLAWATANTLQVRLNTGSGSFAPVYTVSTATGRTRLCLGDLDGDGDADIAASHADSTIRIHWNNGDGSFDIVPDILDLGAAATAINSHDADADGDDDLILALGDRRLGMLRSNGNGTFAAFTVISSRHAPATFINPGDADDDGDPDLLTVFEDDDRMGWFANIGGGIYGSDPQLVLEHLRFCNQVQLVDVDQDGAKDIVAASSHWDEISWFRNDGTLNFAPVRDLRRGIIDPNGLVALDDDNDGDTDFFISSSTTDSIQRFRCNGPSNYGPPTAISTVIDAPVGPALTDVDADGEEDVLLVNTYGNGSRITWFEGSGNGTFVSHVFNPQGVWPENPRAGDLDGDGDNDIIRIASYPVLEWHANNGSDLFPDDPITIISNTFGMHAFELGDLDGDGDLDIFAGIVNAGLQQLIWMPNDGFGNFFTWNTIVFDMPKPDILALRDIDQDGDLDLFALSTTEESAFLVPGHGDGTFGDTLRLADEPFLVMGGITFGDLDGDDDEDIVIHSYDNGMIAWVENEVSYPLGIRTVPGASDMLKVFPDPMRQSTTIEAASEILILDIFNSSGMIVRRQFVGGSRTVHIERGGLASGLHLIRAHGCDGGMAHARLMVE